MISIYKGSIKKLFIKCKVLILGGIAVIAYWFLETLMHYLFFSQGDDYFELLYTLSGHELWTRLMGVGVILLFSFISHLLYVSEANAKNRIDHLSAVLKSIRNVNQLITREKDQKVLLQKSCKILIETRGFLSAWVALFDDSENVVFTAEAGIGTPFDSFRRNLSQGDVPNCFKSALTQKKPLLIEDPLAFCADCPLTLRYGERYVLTTRLECKNTIYGIITVSLPHQSLNLEEEKKLFEEVADDIAFALENMSLEESERLGREKLKAALAHADFLKDLLAHDIGNILNNIKAAAGLMNMPHFLKSQPDKREDLMSIMDIQIQRGASLISNVRWLSHVYESEIITSPLDPIPILDESLRQIMIRFEGKTPVIETRFSETPVKVMGGPLLIDAFDNILRNAIIHNDTTPPKLWIYVSEDRVNSESFVKIEFKDNAMGIPDERKKSIFERTQYSGTGKGGMGIGLSLVKKIITSYGGKVWVENRVEGNPSEGSNFIILLRLVNDLKKVASYGKN